MCITTVEDVVSKTKGLRVVFTNGCFDIIHEGHIRLLAEAKLLGDILCVGLNSDKSVDAQKKTHKRVFPCESRAFVLSSLRCVDFVVVFEEDTPQKLIEKLRPSVIVKGCDWQGKSVAGQNVAPVHFIHQTVPYSTSWICSMLDKER